ncbi:MAG: hypothetical protein LRZ99_05215 [Desulfotomaculum sp.]|nr:hypothetical protein [Desulfotomaculum sp.]
MSAEQVKLTALQQQEPAIITGQEKLAGAEKAAQLKPFLTLVNNEQDNLQKK